MQNLTLVPLRHSITTHLIKIVFSLYIVVALLVTLAHMGSEYLNAREQVLQELETIYRIMAPGIINAVWEINTPQLKLIISGAAEFSTVTGLAIYNDHNQLLQVYGQSPLKNSLNPTKISEHLEQEGNTFWLEFPLKYVRDGKENYVGTFVIISDFSIVFKRVENGFILIIFNALIKTIALWVIFLGVSRKILSLPLANLTTATSQIDFDRLTPLPGANNKAAPNELDLLCDAFNQMIEKLRISHDKISENQHLLEQTVTKRTQELKDKNAMLQESMLEAQKANQAKSLFLANMSHEIRTPLNSVMVAIELLSMADLEPQYREYLELIKSGGENLLSLLTDVLDFSNLDAGTLKLEIASFYPKDCLLQVIQIMNSLASAKQLKLQLHYDPTIPNLLMGDSARLRQVLIHLINNAINFTQQGSIEVVVRPLFVHDAEVNLQFQVKDNGMGISKLNQLHLFNPFYQVDSTTSRTQAGAGLGLAICAKMVELMNGKIEISSSENKGTTVTFTIQCLLVK